jgi:hypothetical protein
VTYLRRSRRSLSLYLTSDAGCSFPLSQIARYALRDDDIRKLLGYTTPILRYPELEVIKHPDALFKGHKYAMLLFLVDGPNDGHWISVINHPDAYEVFDSFGTAIDGDRAWLSRDDKIEFNQCLPHLSNLLKKGTKRIIHNTAKLQKDDANTCGRWASWRALNMGVPLGEFCTIMKSNGSPDLYVTKCTYDLLGK